MILASRQLTAQEAREPYEKVKGVHLLVHTGLSFERTKLTERGQSKLGNDKRNQLYLSAALDFEINDRDSNWIVRLGMSYKPLRFHGVSPEFYGTTNTYDLKLRLFIPEVDILYRIKLISRLRLYGGVGAALAARRILMNDYINYDKQDDHYLRFNDIQLDDIKPAVTVSLGLQWRNRYDFNFKYWGSTAGSSHELVTRINNKMVTLALGYRL
jgi:hypothetical protein